MAKDSCGISRAIDIVYEVRSWVVFDLVGGGRGCIAQRVGCCNVDRKCSRLGIFETSRSFKTKSC